MSTQTSIQRINHESKIKVINTSVAGCSFKATIITAA